MVNKALRKIKLTDDTGDFRWLTILEDANIQDITDEGGLVTGGGQGKFGDYEPRFANIEQRDWSGGRGQEDLEDLSRYFDSENIFSLIPGRIIPSIFWTWARGLRNEDRSWLTTVVAEENSGSIVAREYSKPFTASASYSVKYAYAILYANGASNFTAKIYTDVAGSPDTVITNGTSGAIAHSDIDGGSGVPVIVKFTFATAPSVTASTDYHFVIAQSGGGTSIMTDNGKTTDSKMSEDSWSSESTGLQGMLFRLTDEDEARHLIPFEHFRAQMALAVYEDGSNSKLYINGDRGKATGGSADTIIDTDKGLRGTWTADQWDDAWVWIINGAGEGQKREITANTAAGTITVTPDFDVTPDTTSTYIIYVTDDWHSTLR